MNITITKRQILQILEKVTKRIEDENFDSLDIDDDWYHFIPTNTWKNMEHDIHIGSLFDDINSLKLLIKDDKRPCTYVDFDRVASLLRFISEENNPSSSSGV